jgi:hypothetical protein
MQEKLPPRSQWEYVRVETEEFFTEVEVQEDPEPPNKQMFSYINHSSDWHSRSNEGGPNAPIEL